MAADLEIQVELSDIRSELKKISKQAETGGKSAGERFESGLSNGIKKAGKFAAAAGVAIGGVLAFAAKKAAEAASIQEEAVTRLNQALAAQGNFTKEVSQELQTFASQLQSVTTFGDEAIIGQLAFAQSLGASVEQSKQIVSAAADMSAALGIDLNSAVRNINKTLGGYAGELGEVIPELKNLTQEQLRAGAGVELLAKQFDGFAKAQANTFAGATKQASNAFGDLMEQFGFLITQNPIFIKLVQGRAKSFESMAETIKNARKEIILLSINAIGTLAETLRGVGNIVLRTGKNLAEAFSIETTGTDIAGIISLLDAGLGPAVRNAGRLAKIFFESFLTGASAVKLGIFEIANVTNDFFKSVGVNIGIDKFLEKNLDSSRKSFEKFSTELNSSFLELISDNTTTTVSEQFRNLFQSIKDAAVSEDGEKTIFDEMLEPFSVENLMMLAESYSSFADNLNNKTAEVAPKLADKWKNAAKNIAAAVNQVMVGAVSAGMQRLGASLVNGVSAFDDFGKQILSMLGDMSIKIGEVLLLTGIGMQSLFELSGAKAIVAGLGLIALGGILKAFAGSKSGVGGFASPSAQEDIAGFGGVGSNTTIDPEEAETEKGTEVTVNIQGDVLDSEESGMRIVNIINDAFDKQGVKINQGIA